MGRPKKDNEIFDLLEAIRVSVDKPDRPLKDKVDDLENAFALVCDIPDRDKCWRWNWWVRDCAANVLQRTKTPEVFERAMLILRKTYLLGARRENFDDYCIWLEIDRPRNQRFYQNRRKSLLPLVESLQDLYDGKIRFLGVSMPPRVGKSTICLIFLSFVFGHRPTTRSLCVGYSTSLAKSFFERIMEFIEGDEYRWADVFPDLKGITRKSVDDLSFDTKPRPTAFPTCVCRGIDGSLTGGCDCSAGGIQYCDDLVRDYEESLSPNRLEMLWGKYVNQVRDRMHGCMQLMVGTRWNVFDPLGRLQEMNKDNPQFRFLIIPALNEKGESNFAYEHDGFSTEDYKELRRITGPAEWSAKFLGRPYIREGLLFEPGELRRYDGHLPDEEPDKIVAAVDVALGGGDSVSMPIAYVYGEDIYIPDVVFNNGTTAVTTLAVANRIALHGIDKTQVEENSGGLLYKEAVQKILNDMSVHRLLTSKRARGERPKAERILFRADYIKMHFIFLDEEHMSGEYRRFMRELCLYTATGKNPHDDAPDSLAQLADMLDTRNNKKIKIAARLF